MKTQTAHIPVLLDEVISLLNLQPDHNGIDCTMGGGGHAVAVLEKTSPQGRLIGIDWDEEALEKAALKIKKYNSRVFLVNDNYRNIKRIIKSSGLQKINFIICDLGLSSDQLDDEKRGFSFNSKGVLDLRFSQNQKLTADKILNSWPENDLADIFKSYANERLSQKIARQIVALRKDRKITGEDLSDICKTVYASAYQGKFKQNPATKVWQALRIAVNDELDNLKNFLPEALDVLDRGGRLAVITFHSLEDKLVKDFLKKESKDCLCPPDFPVCRCDHRARVKLVNSKPITVSEKERQCNNRSRSAKLRVVVKI